jgi:hypothetical protein
VGGVDGAWGVGGRGWGSERASGKAGEWASRRAGERAGGRAGERTRENLEACALTFASSFASSNPVIVALAVVAAIGALTLSALRMKRSKMAGD